METQLLALIVCVALVELLQGGGGGGGRGEDGCWMEERIEEGGGEGEEEEQREEHVVLGELLLDAREGGKEEDVWRWCGGGCRRSGGVNTINAKGGSRGRAAERAVTS